MDKINMDYTVNRDAVTDWQNELNRADSNYWNLYGYDYQVGRDAVDDAWKQKEFDEAVRQFNASQKGSSGGKVGSLTTSTPKNMINKAVNNIVKKANEPAPKYTYEETPAVNSFNARIRTPHEFARGSNDDNAKYKTYKDYVRGMLEKYEGDLTDDEIATIANKYGL
jgi:hypothetical protein